MMETIVPLKGELEDFNYHMNRILQGKLSKSLSAALWWEVKVKY